MRFVLHHIRFAVVLGGMVSVLSSGPELRAQVIVYYLATPLPPGLHLVANPLPPANPSVKAVFKTLPAESFLFTFDAGQFDTNQWDGSDWWDETLTFDHGQAGFILNPSTNTVRLPWEGAMPAGEYTTEILAGLSALGSKIPEAGRVTSDHELRLNRFDNLYLWDGTNYTVYTYLPDGTWHPREPRLEVAQGFFVNASRSTNWTEVFGP